jgi:predicted RNase H-like HicB family nuclease
LLTWHCGEPGGRRRNYSGDKILAIDRKIARVAKPYEHSRTMQERSGWHRIASTGAVWRRGGRHGSWVAGARLNSAISPWARTLLQHANEGTRGRKAPGEAWLGGDTVERQPSALPASGASSRHHGAGERRQGTLCRDVARYTQEGRFEVNARRYAVVIERTSTGYSAYSPDVTGCCAVGDTEEETRRNFRDALAEHFEIRREIGEPIPEPSSSVDYVEVAA